jgi:hypothetical protein
LPDRKKEEFLHVARKRYRTAAEAEEEFRREAVEDWRFRDGEGQWDESVKQQRLRERRPCLTINRMPSFIRQVSNEQKQNRPAIAAAPAGNGADEEMADIRQGLFRHVEVASHADTARDIAFDSMVTCGIGWYRLRTDYVDDQGFDQEIIVSPIRDWATVYCDPACQKPDRSDAKYIFIVEDVPRDEFKEQYPKAEAAGLQDWSAYGNDRPDWIKEESIRVAEYYYVETDQRTLVLLSDGATAFLDELPVEFPEGITEVRRRDVENRSIKWAKITALDVLEEREVIGEIIPVIPMVAEEYFIDGQRKCKGLIRDARDAQRSLNYQTSAQAEAVGMAPKAPYIATPKQIGNHRAMWEAANAANMPYLLFDPDPQNPGPPQRQIAQVDISAMAMLRAQAGDDLKSVTGLYDASLGQNTGREQSGRQVLALQQQGSTTNFHFTDSLQRAIELEAKIMDRWLAEIYDTNRVVHIVKPDSSTEAVLIAKSFDDNLLDSNMKAYDPSIGRYDIVVSTGPSFKTRREQAAQQMLDLMKVLPPQMMAEVAYLLPKNLDFPEHQEFSDRLAPPDVKAQKQQEKGPDPQQLTAELAKAHQMIEALSQQLHSTSAVIEQKKVEKQGDFERKMAELNQQYQIELLRQQTALMTAEVKANAQLATLEIENRLSAIQDALQQQHEQSLQMQSQAHEAALASQQHAQGLEAQQQMAEQQPSEPSADAGA